MRTMGEYDGVAKGEYSVKITKTELQDTGETETNEEGQTVPVQESKNVLPEVFASFATSGLKASVSDESKDLEFDLAN